MDSRKMSDDYFEFMLKKALDEYAEEEGSRLKEELKDVEEPVLSGKYKKSINKIEKDLRENKKYRKTPVTKIKAAVIALVVLFSGSIVTYNANADFKSFINKLFTKTDTHIDITYNKSNLEYDFSEIPESWEYFYIPEYVPDGYRVKEINSTEDWIDIIYARDEKEIDFIQFKGNVTYSIDSERSEMSEVEISGNKGYLQHHEVLTVIYWNNSEMIFNLSGTIEDEELIKVAESIHLIGR